MGKEKDVIKKSGEFTRESRQVIEKGRRMWLDHQVILKKEGRHRVIAKTGIDTFNSSSD